MIDTCHTERTFICTILRLRPSPNQQPELSFSSRARTFRLRCGQNIPSHHQKISSIATTNKTVTKVKTTTITQVAGRPKLLVHPIPKRLGTKRLGSSRLP